MHTYKPMAICMRIFLIIAIIAAAASCTIKQQITVHVDESGDARFEIEIEDYFIEVVKDFQVFAEEEEDHRHTGQKDAGVQTCEPHRILGPLWLAGPQVLPHQGGGGIADAEGRQKGKQDDPDRQGIGRNRGAAEGGYDADQNDPAGSGHQELAGAGGGQPQEAQHDIRAHTPGPPAHVDAPAATSQEPELEENT